MASRVGMDAEDLPTFPEDSAPRGFIFCELCSHTVALSDYHKHIGSKGCVAEARRVGYTDNKPRGWKLAPGFSAEDNAEFFAKLRIPYHAPTGTVQPWVAMIMGCNASKDDRTAALIRCLRDLEHRRAVIGALRLFGGKHDEPEIVGQVLRGE